VSSLVPISPVSASESREIIVDSQRSCLPIGVFDSGVGGLSVLREIRVRLPHEDLLYVADSAHVPYGSKTQEFIVERARAISGFLLGRGAKVLVVACNTATAAAAGALRTRWPEVAIIGMEPAVKPAVAATRNGIVGILATVGTLRSSRFAALLDDFAKDVTVVTQPAPGLAEAVERGDLASEQIRTLVARFTRPLVEAGADTIVLGCTHYPFLRPLIAASAGPAVALVETGAAVARQVERRLDEACLVRLDRDHQGIEEFWTTGPLEPGQRALEILWSKGAVMQQLE
jgi:glutamate racemase